MLNSKSCGVNLQDVSGSPLAFSVINTGTLVSLVFADIMYGTYLFVKPMRKCHLLEVDMACF